ncbi:hypothetical protein ES703_81569 [subsurface metagenome]
MDVCILEDNRIFVLYKNNIIAEAKLSKSNKVLKQEKKIEKLLNQREYHVVPVRKIYRPPANHPWKKFSYGKGKVLEK